MGLLAVPLITYTTAAGVTATALTVGQGIALAGTVAAGVSSYQASRNERRAADSNQRAYEARRQALEQQAQNRQLQAQEIQTVGTQNIERIRRNNQREIARMRARIAASGVRLSGSALEVLGDTASTLEMDALDMFRQSEVDALHQRQQAEQRMFEANQASLTGEQARQAGYSQSRGTLLSGVGRTVSSALTIVS